MIEVYKIIHGHNDVPFSRFFSLSHNNLRGHSFKLARPNHWRTSIKGNWFSIRCIEPWNKRPESVVTAPNIVTFRARYDKHMDI